MNWLPPTTEVLPWTVRIWLTLLWPSIDLLLGSYVDCSICSISKYAWSIAKYKLKDMAILGSKSVLLLDNFTLSWTNYFFVIDWLFHMIYFNNPKNRIISWFVLKFMTVCLLGEASCGCGGGWMSLNTFICCSRAPGSCLDTLQSQLRSEINNNK